MGSGEQAVNGISKRRTHLEQIKRKKISYYVKCLIGFAVMFLFQLIPPFGAITRQGMQILGIYLGTLLLWALVDLIWPSLLGIILVSLTGYMSFNEYISAGFGNTTVIFVFLISIFASFITNSGVADSIARSIVSLRFARGRPWLISALFVLSSWLIACLISSVAATIVVLAFFSQFARQAGYRKGDSYPVILMVCITFAAHMGGSVWTFRTPDAILVGYITAQGGHVPLIPYFLCSVFIGGGALVIYLLFAKLFLRADINPLRRHCEGIETIPMTQYQKQILSCSLVLLFLLILENMLSAQSIPGALLKKLGTNGIVVVMLAVMMFFRRQGSAQPFVDLEQGTRQVPWRIFYVIVFNMPMANILNDSSLGINTTIMNVVGGIFGNNASVTLFVFLMTLLIIICTTFIGNVPVCLMFYNTVSLFAPALGVSTTALACMISLTSNASVILPGSNPQAAMLHGQKDWVETRDVVRYGIIQSLSVLITVMLAYSLFLKKVL